MLNYQEEAVYTCAAQVFKELSEGGHSELVIGCFFQVQEKEETVSSHICVSVGLKLGHIYAKMILYALCVCTQVVIHFIVG